MPITINEMTLEDMRKAEKRAEAQALRKAFHINLPSIEDIGSPDYEPESVKVVEVKAEKQRSTFEANGLPPEAKEALTPEAKEASINAQQQVVYKRDPASLKKLPEAMRACFEDYGSNPRKSWLSWELRHRYRLTTRRRKSIRK
jgi:hypothetical protein